MKNQIKCEKPKNSLEKKIHMYYNNILGDKTEGEKWRKRLQ